MRALERRKGWKSWKNSSFWRLSDNFRGASYRINPRCPVTPGVRRIWVSDPYKPILEARPRKPQAPHLAEGTKITPRQKYPSLGGGRTPQNRTTPEITERQRAASPPRQRGPWHRSCRQGTVPERRPSHTEAGEDAETAGRNRRAR